MWRGRCTCAAALLLSVGLLGCGGEDPEGSGGRGAPIQGQTGKADVFSSCLNSCGGQADTGCWCDDICAQYGDCCTDKREVCDHEPTGPAGPGPCHGICVHGAGCTDFCPPHASCVKVVDKSPGYWKVLGCGVW